MEGAARAVDEGAHAIFFRFGNMVLEAMHLLEPERVLLGARQVETAGSHDLCEIDLRKVGLDDPRIGIQRADDRPCRDPLVGRRRAYLVEDDDIGEFDLFDQQPHQRPVIAFAGGFAAVGQKVGRAVVLEQVRRIDDSHHRIELRDVGEADTFLVAELEGRGNGQGLGYPGGFDQQVIEAALFGQPPHFLQKIVAKRAADAAIAHLHQLLIGPRQIGPAIADKSGIDIHLAHVIHDHGDLATFAIVQDVIEQCRLPGTEEAGQDGDGEFLKHANLAEYVCNVIKLHKEFAKRMQPRFPRPQAVVNAYAPS